MARNRTHEVHSTEKNENHCGTITREQMLTADRAARRNAQVESGTFVRGGIHGAGKRGVKKESARRNRRGGKLDLRRGDY